MPRKPALLTSAGRMPKRSQHRVSEGRMPKRTSGSRGMGSPEPFPAGQHPLLHDHAVFGHVASVVARPYQRSRGHLFEAHAACH
jgi:hypothetical protein